MSKRDRKGGAGRDAAPGASSEVRTPKSDVGRRTPSARSDEISTSNPDLRTTDYGLRRSTGWTLLVLLGLVVLNLAVFGPVSHYDFVQLDDPAQVTENVHVTGGLTPEAVGWAFTSAHAGYWMPLVWLSHMADVQLYGLNASGHHVTNLLLHIANTLLLFGLLLSMTGARARSAFVAALFAVHPLHVESVAWVTERKDVLSTLFWMVTLWAYVHYTRRPGVARYAAMVVAFALGLMAKPMLVTLPFVMLLLDFWPLGRFGPGLKPGTYDRRNSFGPGLKPGTYDRSTGAAENRRPRGDVGSGLHAAPSPGDVGSGLQAGTTHDRGRDAAVENDRPTRGDVGSGLQAGTTWRALIVEKLPLFALAAAGSAVAFITQRNSGAVGTLESFPFSLRVENAVVTYVTYLWKMIWPARLVAFYPHPDSVPAWSVAVSAAILAVVTILVLRGAVRRPYLAVGWLWYLGTLVPVIGLVQVGLQSMADRFTYVPLVGIFIAVAWAVPEMLSRWVPARRAIPVVAAATVVACAVAARAQVPYWRDSVAMWTRTTEVTMNTDSYHAHLALGRALRGQGRLDEAIGHLTEAAAEKPDAAEAQFELGAALASQGREEEGMSRLAEAVRLRPDLADAHVELALLLSKHQRVPEAIAHYEDALRVKGDVPEVRNNLGSLLADQGRLDEAIAQFSEAVRLKPNLEVAHVNLGIALVKADRVNEAVREFGEALRINPQNTLARRAYDGLTGRAR